MPRGGDGIREVRPRGGPRPALPSKPGIRLVLPIAIVWLLVGCGGSAGAGSPSAGVAATSSVATSSATAGGQDSAPSEPAATPEDGAGASGGGGGGPIGGDVGDRSRGSVQAQISGGLTASVDLPYAPALARLLVDGPDTAYLPFTDPAQGTLFLTVANGGLLVQYVGPDQVGVTNGATPCEFHLDTLDAKNAKGTFTCKGMLLVKNDGMGSADMTGGFEGHQ